MSLKLFHVFYQQKEEGKVQGQLNHTDSSQYIRDLKDQIAELKHEVRLVQRALGPSVLVLPYSAASFLVEIQRFLLLPFL